jgi:hypothetical protein
MAKKWREEAKITSDHTPSPPISYHPAAHSTITSHHIAFAYHGRNRHETKITSHMSPSNFHSTLLISATVTCLALGLIVLLHWRRRYNEASCQDKKVRLAKESFRVRKSNLLAVSGRGRTNRKRNNYKRWVPSSKCVEDPAESTSWLDSIMDLFKKVSALLFHRDGKSTSNNATSKPTYSSRLPPKIDMGDYYNNVKVVGLDCEMVGGGKGGMKSLLARCSVVILDCIPLESKTNPQNKLQATTPNSIDQHLIVLYDKYVIPKARITDYRTQWSGITKETFDSTTHDIPIVTFYQCQKEITELFSSIDGKSVVVVGHALENDFDALEIKVRSSDRSFALKPLSASISSTFMAHL